MALAMWAKSAAGTNLTFVKGFGRILKSWREIFQNTLQRKQLPIKPKTKSYDAKVDAKDRCLLEAQPSLIRRSSKLQSRIFHSVFPRTATRTLASELRRQAALRFSASSVRNFRSMPIMSLIGVSLGVNLTSVMDDGTERMMSELRETFRGFTWQTEPLEKLPTCLDDLLINENSIANGCEGAVYKAKVKVDAETDVEDADYNLALKAVFNYGAESNAHSILCELEREVVPLRPEGCQLEASLSKRVGRLPPHPNIVDMPGIFVDDMLVTEDGLRNFPAAMPHRLDPERFYGHNKTLYLVMRRRSSHLREFLSRRGADDPVTMTTRCQILAQLLEGVAHLGQNGVVHRDLKADNILVDVPSAGGCPRVEICDFGCCLAEEDKSVKVPFPSRDMYLGGNSWLMAPEISTAAPGPASVLDFGKSDLWAVGAVAYEILGADNPFYPSKDNSRRQLDSRSYREEDLPPLPEDVPEPVKRLVKALLSRDPSKRPRASVAAAVAQMTVHSSLFGESTTNTNLSASPPSPKFGPDLQHNLGSAPFAKDRNWLGWVLAQGLALLCQLTFADQSKPWGMESIMSFLFLSRLTYADFKAAMGFF